jgi:hypothetical protein
MLSLRTPPPALGAPTTACRPKPLGIPKNCGTSARGVWGNAGSRAFGGSLSFAISEPWYARARFERFNLGFQRALALPAQAFGANTFRLLGLSEKFVGTLLDHLDRQFAHSRQPKLLRQRVPLGESAEQQFSRF